MLNIKNTLDGYLKNVEVIGNTIQNENDLADIRSVGDKVEGQELYKVDIVSCGKNLFNMSNMEITGSNCSVTNNGGILTIQPNSYNNKNYAVCLSINIKAGTYFYSGTATSSTQFRSGGGQGEVVFNLASGTDRVVKLSKDTDCIVLNFLAISSGVITFDLNSIQIEVGTVATPYEPYQENKLEILSPVQIEKVGDVSDRIICKGGVWGVEKNIVSIYPTFAYNIRYEGFAFYNYILNDIVDTSDGSKIYYLSDRNVSTFNDRFHTDNLKEGNTYISPSKWVYVATQMEKSDFENTYNGKVLVKYPTTKPQFIALPHDQQIKLRTFAGQTNISFLTEIEGTIKAQVPKSLGATVATHTEQISNLSKELDRVNKLEESTVSTVETVSNFTTVRETSSGYFEDIKLEGKSLVNLNQYIENNLVLTIPETKFYNQLSVCDLSKIKLNTTYTLLFDIEMIENNSTWELGKNTLMSFGQGDTKHNIMAHPVKMSLSNNGAKGGGYSCNVYQHNAITFNIQELNSMGNNYLAIRPVVCKQLGTGESIKYKMSNIILLEGDYTNNPPSYFEGIKSVGEDIEEISIKSINENLFDEDSLKPYIINSDEDTITVDYKSMYKKYIYPIKTKTPVTFSYTTKETTGGKQPRFEFNYSDNTYDDINPTISNEFTKYTKTSNVNKQVESMKVVYGSGNGNWLIKKNSIMLNRGTISKDFIQHKSDKKRLLYYNDETQTWEKPILREWDTIEKHSDGKYYYHKRSGEVVLNGSEDWEKMTPNYIEDNNTYFCSRVLDNLNVVQGQCINDTFNIVEVWSKNLEGLYLYSTSVYKVRININKSKLSTQDVAGLKSWLKANPTTVVYQLAQEEVYECTNIDLMTYSGETNYIINSGAISPKSLLKVHNNISNVVKILQEKVSLLESTFISGLKYMLAGDMYSLATILYPEDFTQEDNMEQDIMVIPE